MPQNGRLGDADIERLKLTDSYINGAQVGVFRQKNKINRCATSFTSQCVRFMCVVVFVPQYRMVDPAHGVLDESYTPEDDSQEVHSVFSEEGTTRRLDVNGVKKIIIIRAHDMIGQVSERY